MKTHKRKRKSKPHLNLKKSVTKYYVFRIIDFLILIFYFYFLNIRCENSHKFVCILLTIISNKITIYLFLKF